MALHAADPRDGRAARRAGRACRGGGQPARLARYRANLDVLLAGMSAMGIEAILARTVQAPVIATFDAPADRHYQFNALYERVRARGFALYSGKLTRVDRFRVGCIGAIGPDRPAAAAAVIGDALRDLGVGAAVESLR